MKRFLLVSGIIYLALSIVALIFLFNNFTSSAQTNYIFRIVSMVLLCFISSFPLVLATCYVNKIVWLKVLLYATYVLVESAALYFAFRTFGDNSFMFNSQISADAFKNSQINLTSPLWICLLINAISVIPVLSVKMARGWPDWTYLLFVPFSIAIIGVLVASIPISIIVLIAIGNSNRSSSTTTDSISSSSYDDYSYSDYDSNDDSNEDSQEERHGVYRSPGECFYDGNGIYRSPGECYYDGKGIYRSPGECFYDGNGIYRSPGECYYDGNGIYRSPDECFYDGGN